MDLSDLITKSTLPRSEINLLISFLLKKEIIYLLAHPEMDIPKIIEQKFKVLEKKRKQGFSIAAITSEKEFYGLKFKVSYDVLIPRPETEIIVDAISKEIGNNKKYVLADIGTGSGAIIISSAIELKNRQTRIFKKTEFLAVDISGPALKIALDNARLHKLEKKIKFFKGNLISPIVKKVTNQNLILSANLPYLTKAQIKSAPSIKREPIIALDGGKDGLKYYIELFQQLTRVNFKSLFLICEIDPSQTKKIRKTAANYFKGAEFEIVKDLSRKNRFIIIRQFLNNNDINNEYIK